MDITKTINVMLEILSWGISFIECKLILVFKVLKLSAHDSHKCATVEEMKDIESHPTDIKLVEMYEYS